MFKKFDGFTLLLLIAVIIGFVKETHIEANETGIQLSVVAPEANVEKRAGGFRFTEGPAGDSEGNLIFTDPHQGRIYKLSTNNKVSTFIEYSGSAIGLFFAAGVIVLLGVLFLMWMETGGQAVTTTENRFVQLLFEAVSAFGTVGLSTGITPRLAAPAKLCLIVLMFLGRLGPLGLISATLRGGARRVIGYPYEDVQIG